MAVEHFFAVQTDLHRPVEHQRRLGDDDLVGRERIALATEAAAVRRGNDADVRCWHRQRLGEGAVQVVRGLRARVHDQLAVRISQRHRGVLFDRQVRVAFEEEHVIEHMVRAVDRLIDVAELERHGFMHVAVIAVVVNAGLVEGQAIRRRRERAQRFVVDVDQIDRTIRGGLVAGDDGGHRGQPLVQAGQEHARRRGVLVEDVGQGDDPVALLGGDDQIVGPPAHGLGASVLAVLAQLS